MRFFHGPEMKKLSLKATLAESSYESAIQIIFVALISLWAKEISHTGLMSMASSLLMIGKSAAEGHLTFGAKNLLKGVSLQKHTCLLATVLPVFLFTALFRVGSLAVILAWDWSTSLTALTFWGASFLVGLVTIRCCGHCFCCAPWQMACFYAGFRSTNEEPEENEEPISFIARGCIENNVNVNEVPRPGWLPTRRFMEDLSLGEVLTGFVHHLQLGRTRKGEVKGTSVGNFDLLPVLLHLHHPLLLDNDLPNQQLLLPSLLQVRSQDPPSLQHCQSQLWSGRLCPANLPP